MTVPHITPVRPDRQGPETLTARLTMLTLLYTDRENLRPGWEMDAVDNVILTVLEHHGIPYEEMGPHETFLAMAPYLFLEQVL